MMPVVLASGSLDHKIRLWDATSGNVLKVLTFGESQVNCIAISPDKRLLAVGGNPLIHIFEVNGGDDKPVMTYSGHTNNVTAVGFQKDQKWLFSSSEDGTIKVWDRRFQSSSASRTYECGSSVNTVVLHPNQGVLISGDQQGYIRVWDLENNILSEQHVPINDASVRSISIALDATFLAVGLHRGKVFIYSLKESKGGLQLLRSFQAHDSYLLKCVISPDMNMIATTSADRTVKIWNTRTYEIEQKLTQHQKWVWDAVFSADSVYLITVSSDQSGKLWDLRSGEIIRNYSGHGLGVTCVALNDQNLRQ